MTDPWQLTNEDKQALDWYMRLEGSGGLSAVVESIKASAYRAALAEAADDIQALHPGEVKNSVVWLRARAAEVGDHE